MLVDPLAVFMRAGPTAPAPLTLARTAIAVRLVGPICDVTIVRTFRNHRDGPIEGVLTLPCHPAAVVHTLVIAVDGIAWSARAVRAETMADDHEAAMARGYTSIRAQQIAPAVLLVAIAPIPRGATVDVRMVHAQVPDWRDKDRGGHQGVLSIPLSADLVTINAGLAEIDHLTLTPASHPASLTVSGDDCVWSVGTDAGLAPETTVAVPSGGTLDVTIVAQSPGQTLRVAGRNADILELRRNHSAEHSAPAIETTSMPVGHGWLHAMRHAAARGDPAPRDDAVRAFAAAMLARELAPDGAEQRLIDNGILSLRTGLAFVDEDGAQVCAPILMHKVALSAPPRQRRPVAMAGDPAVPAVAVRRPLAVRLLDTIRRLIAALFSGRS